MENQDNESTMADRKVEKEEEKIEVEESKPVMESPSDREWSEYENAYRQVMIGTLSVNTLVHLSRNEYIKYFQKDPGFDYVETSLLHVAVGCHDETFYNFLISNGADVTIETEHFGPVLFNAIMMRNSKLVEALLSAGADANKRSELWINDRMYAYTPLELAAKKNLADIVKILIDKGAEVNGYNNLNNVTPLYLAAQHSSTDVIEVLVEAGADVDLVAKIEGTAKMETALSVVIKRGRNLKAVKAMLKNLRININYADDLGFSFLHYAVLLSHNKEMVSCLLDAGINVDLRDGDGELPIEYDDDDNKSYKICIPVIKEHIVKLIAADFHVCEENMMAIQGHEFDDLRVRCYEEIDAMRRRRLYGTDLNCYRVLHLSRHVSSAILKHGDLDFTYDDELRARFPLYSGMIIYHLDRARRQAMTRYNP
ncbi:uncharacterized protein LOC103571875 [Microplitis demolitor]|uniref:uncharacterized protein LOC103571875 n=1 Tax=Microplitis demolitor TaxID=69319 RepID=UPI00044003F6|nr:uncharacterized protein LOC103571875 [Microplitis demolitor]